MNDYLSSIASRLAAVETKLGLPVGKTPLPAAAGSGSGAAIVSAFDEFIAESVAPFVATSRKIGGKVEKIGVALENGFAQVRAFIQLSTTSKKPADATPLLKPILEAINAISALKERDDFENHAKAVAEGAQALSWVNPGNTMPGPFCQDMVDASIFWANKVRKDFKEKEDGALHTQWCTELNNLWKNLAAFVKANAPTGLSWNASGSEATAPAAAAPAASSASAAPAAASAAPAASITNVFAELSQIDQSSGKTAGLRHVTADMKSKNQEKKSSVVPGDVQPKKAPAKKWGGSDGPVKADPKFELQGQKWVIQGQDSMVELKEDQVSVKHTIYIYGCEGATIVIGGKVNTITIDGCKKTKVLFENALALVEVVNCRNVQLQIKGRCPTASVDKTDGFLLYLSYEAAGETKIVSSKSSEMNVEIPVSADPDAEYKSYPIPEQFYHRFNEAKTALSSEVSELYTVPT